MDGCLSTVDHVGKERSDAIDKMIEEDQKRFKRECKILLLGKALCCVSSRFSNCLGSGESRKSTIVKQMKIIHREDFSEAELAEYTPTIYKNVLESAHSVVMFMKKIGLECEDYSNRVCDILSCCFFLSYSTPKALADKVLDFKFDETKHLK